MQSSHQQTFGAVPAADGSVTFRVWAPAPERVAVRVDGTEHVLEPRGDGVFETAVADAASATYTWVLDGVERADPCSRDQPEGLDGPSHVLDASRFGWTDANWHGLDPAQLVVYELHVGTFSDEGTFDGVGEHLDELRELGVTAIELMPIGTFPGSRNWGYDGVCISAPHVAYGGPVALARLVDRAHAAGLGVILDVVYNHVGPGADLEVFGPYFTDRHETAWGKAIDFARRPVREWAIQNAELWVRDYHVDGLRLDATHAIVDDSDPHVLEELADRVHALDARALVIAEMQTGDLRPIERWHADAQWADEFHHVLHVLLTGEHEGYYAPYRASVADLGAQLAREPARRLVYCSQNHDQVGNRAFGDRPRADELRLRAAALLFAPQIPLLFMGEEHGEQRPFQFFTDHQDPFIADATREGRRREFARFAAFAGEEVPDPQAESTFLASKLDRARGDERLLAFYRELIALRPHLPPHVDVEADEDARFLRVRRGDHVLLLNFGNEPRDGVPPRDARFLPGTPGK